jgi:hypothetical protein
MESPNFEGGLNQEIENLEKEIEDLKASLNGADEKDRLTVIAFIAVLENRLYMLRGILRDS